MNKYRVAYHVEANQWFESGDHEAVITPTMLQCVNHFQCPNCENKTDEHGKIKDGPFVCPGDYIVTGIDGKYFNLKPDVFHERFERID